jgi:hypothetical protein
MVLSSRMQRIIRIKHSCVKNDDERCSTYQSPQQVSLHSPYRSRLFIIESLRPSVLARHMLSRVFHRFRGVKLIQWFQPGLLVEENPSLDEIWQSLRELISYMRASGDRKNIVKLFQSALLRLRYEQKDHDQCDNVKTTLYLKR